MKHDQNFYRTQTGVAQTQKNNSSNVVKFDTVKRTENTVLEEIGILHAGIVSACKKAAKA